MEGTWRRWPQNVTNDLVLAGCCMLMAGVSQFSAFLLLHDSSLGFPPNSCSSVMMHPVYCYLVVASTCMVYGVAAVAAAAAAAAEGSGVAGIWEWVMVANLCPAF